MNRDERIESYYNESAWSLAEWLVDSEDAYQRRGEDMSALEVKLRMLRIERDNLLDILAALEAAGVDNWEGYGEALRSLDEEDE
jgi:hypothetical protein